MITLKPYKKDKLLIVGLGSIGEKYRLEAKKYFDYKSIFLFSKHKSFGMDLLIKKLLKLKKRICIFPIKEDEWKDTGNWNDYFEASQKR